MEHHDLRVYTE